MAETGTISGGSNEHVVVVVVVVVVLHPQHNHHFQADWLYEQQYPEEKPRFLFRPFLQLRRREEKREIKSEWLHDSERICDEEPFQAPAISEAIVDVRDIE